MIVGVKTPTYHARPIAPKELALLAGGRLGDVHDLVAIGHFEEGGVRLDATLLSSVVMVPLRGSLLVWRTV
jgi:hypothetical protein